MIGLHGSKWSAKLYNRWILERVIGSSGFLYGMLVDLWPRDQLWTPILIPYDQQQKP